MKTHALPLFPRGRGFTARSHCLPLALLAAVMLSLCAEAASPSLASILPRGGQRGTEVEITLAGERLDDAVELFFHDPGITMKAITVESAAALKATLEIAPDCRLGTQLIRVRTRSGLSNGVLFSVGALPQFNETEPNSLPEQANDFTLDHTAEGVIESEDVDYYAVELTEGQRLAVELEGLRLGGMLYTGMPFDPKVRLFGPQGHERVAADDTPGFLQDPAFVYVAQETGRHLIAVSDASYGGNGNARYRLHVGAFPRPLSFSPLGGPLSAAMEVNWLGDPGLAGVPGSYPALEPLVVPAVDGIDPANIIFPKGVQAPMLVNTEGGVAPFPFTVRRVDLPVTMEAEPNNGLDVPTVGPVPGAFEGVISAQDDHDVFAFEGAPHGVYDVRVWARELGSPLDSVLDAWNPEQKHLGNNDDTYGADARLRVTVDADGRYFLRVRDHLGNGGETYAYRIEAVPVEPRLSMSVLENRPSMMTVHQGACNYLLVSASREDFDTPVTLWLDGVPQGVEAKYSVIPAGATQQAIFFKAAPDAPTAQSPLRILGLGELDGKFIAGDLRQEVRLVEGQNQTTFFAHYVDRIAVAVAEPAPFTVRIVPPAAPFVHGTGRNITVEVTRNEGFAEAIALDFPWLPAGLKGGTATIAADQTSAPIYLECQAAAGEQVQNIFVRASAAGYVLVSDLAPVDCQPQWFAFDVPQVETDQGKPIEMVVKVNQVKPFEGEFDVTLLSLPKGVTVTPQKITKDTTELRFPIEVAADAPVGKHPSVMGEAYITVNGEGVRHVSGGGQLTVYQPLPAELATAPAAPEPAKAEGAPERKTRFPTS
jgi:hypothetical protein